MVCSLFATAQYTAISGNGKMLARITEGGKDSNTGHRYYTAAVYSHPHRSLVQRFSLKYGSLEEIDSLALNYNGKFLLVDIEEDHRVYNTRTGELVFRTDEPVQIALAHNDNFFVVASPEYVRAFDGYTGEELLEYEIASNNRILQLRITSNDEHMAAITGRGQVVVWEIGREKARKKFFGSNIVFSQDGKRFTITRENGSRLSIYQYQLPSFSRLKRIGVDQLLREYARDKTVAIRARDPARSRDIVPADHLLENEYMLSHSGDYLALLSRSEGKEKVLYVIDNENEKVAFRQVVGGMKQPVKLNWYNDSLLIPADAMQPKVFNARQGAFQESLDAEALIKGMKSVKKGGRGFPESLISSDFQYLIVPGNAGFRLRHALQNREADFAGWNFLGFAADGQRVFMENRSTGRRAGVDLAGGFPTRSNVHVYDEKEAKLDEEINPGEFKAPSGYGYDRISGFRHISKARASDSLKLVMKTVVTGQNAGVQVQIVDKNGNHYYGAGTDEWKKIWCNLLVRGSDGNPRQIDDFTVTEHRSVDTLPYAMAMVLDFSGSMGWAKADKLQGGVEEFIAKKKDKDEMAIFKYDHKVVRETGLTGNRDRLVRRLYHTDFSAYGGSTALLDAVNAGIFSVKNARNVARKVVVVFTDGMENSSIVTKNEVLANAIESGVSIMAIGYGDQVNRSYLKTLAYNTQGGYYHLYNSSDFDWIFEDIYNKTLNYYSVNYQTLDKGSQVYMLKICDDTLTTDTLLVEFDNDPVDVDLLWKSDDHYVGNPVSESTPVVDWLEYNYPNLSDYTHIKVKQPAVPERVRISEDKMTRIEDEFMQIELPKFNFYYDEVRTVKDTQKRIRELADFMAKYPSILLEIIGHTDNSGTLEYNDSLALNRARKVKGLIVSAGVPPQRLVVKGYGETSPVASNETEAGRARNRRVEFRIQATKQ